MLMHSRRAVMRLSLFGVGAMLLLSGCDFWPPALQAQIEQLHLSVPRDRSRSTAKRTAPQ